MRASPTTAVARSTCFVRVMASGAAGTSTRSPTAALTAELNRLVAVTATVSLTPSTLGLFGIATLASRCARPP